MEVNRTYFYWTFYHPLFMLAIKLFYFLPIKKNKIVFIQSDGEGYGCNLKYIANEIIRKRLDYKMVWLLEDMESPLPSAIQKVRFNRIRAVYELSTSRFVINNYKSKIYVRKKSNQFFIYIPHGQSGAKKAENHSIELPESYKKTSIAHSALMDAFVTTSEYQTDDVRKYYWCNCDVWQIGFPRNDLFFYDNLELQNKIKSRLCIPKNKKILFYTPTFRDNGDDKPFAIDINKALNTLENKFGGEWISLVTLHPVFKWYTKPTFAFSDRIINVSGYKDMQELLLISDILISDYSSTMMDFCLTRRPIFRYASDIEMYKRIRGLKEMYFKMPFPLCHNNEELLYAIKSFDLGSYSRNLEIFLKEYGTVDDGHAAERFVMKLQSLTSH